MAPAYAHPSTRRCQPFKDTMTTWQTKTATDGFIQLTMLDEKLQVWDVETWVRISMISRLTNARRHKQGTEIKLSSGEVITVRETANLIMERLQEVWNHG